MSEPSSSSDRHHFNPMAAILAWVWPGLGHISLGQRRRGLLIMFGVLFLFVSGLLIGGLDVVDHKRDKLWFLAQSLCGPVTFVADVANQGVVKRMPDNWERNGDWKRRYLERDPDVLAQLKGTSLGRVNEIGTLYIALAGLMNLVVILDALHRAPGEPAIRHGRRSEDS
jgi:hypothetical protein